MQSYESSDTEETAVTRIALSCGISYLIESVPHAGRNNHIKLTIALTVKDEIFRMKCRIRYCVSNAFVLLRFLILFTTGFE